MESRGIIGVEDIEVTHAPVGLLFLCKGMDLWVVPQLVLLDEVDAQERGSLKSEMT